MKLAVVIYPGTGVQLKDMLKKSKISNLINERDIEKVAIGPSNKKVVIIKSEGIVRIAISTPHYAYTTKEGRDEMRKLALNKPIEILTYPQNNKRIQELLQEIAEIKDIKNLFITYFY